MVQWTAVNTGLKGLQIKGLGVVGNNLILFTANQGLFVSTNSGDTWQAHPQNSSLPNFNLNSSISSRGLNVCK